VPGNHDVRHEAPSNVDGRSVDWLGLRVYGLGGGGPRRFGFPYEWTEDEVAHIPPPVYDLLLTHTPPFGTALDTTVHGRHVGSPTIRGWALAAGGLLVCGHIHEAAGVEQLGDCLCYNAGSLGEPFGQTQVGIAERPDPALPWTVRHFLL
jgi:Icc-related predicted phosphoesterase